MKVWQADGPSTSAAALEMHLQMLDWCRTVSPEHETQRLHYGCTAQDPSLSDLFVELQTAWTIWLPQMMHRPILDSADTIPMPDGPIDPSIIPAATGVVLIGGEPLDIMPPAVDAEVSVAAVSWSVAALPITSSRSTASAPAVRITPWLRIDGPGPDTDAAPWPERSIVVPLAGAAARMITDADDAEMDHLSAMADRVRWSVSDDPDDWSSDRWALLRWMLANWVWTTDVLPPWIEVADRALRRRSLRLMGDRPDLGEVHVTALRRRLDQTAGDPDAPDREWDHRWIVRGHWRWQACGPGHRDRRLIWVRPHVKGPEDAPLEPVDHVGKIVR